MSVPDAIDRQLRAVLGQTLSLPPSQIAALAESSRLFGALPELDSLAVAALLAEIEDQLGIAIVEDDLSVEDFETYGALLRLVLRSIGR